MFQEIVATAVHRRQLQKPIVRRADVTDTVFVSAEDFPLRQIEPTATPRYA